MFFISTIYYYYSLSFIIARSSAMFLIAASIGETSRQPISIVRSIPKEGWNIEVQFDSDFSLAFYTFTVNPR